MWKWERREKKLQSKQAKMKKHGKNLGDQYGRSIERDLKIAKKHEHLPDM